jgi:hypothetical protein
VCVCKRRLIVAADWPTQGDYLMEIARDVGQFVCEERDRKVVHWSTDCCRFPLFTLTSGDGSYVICTMNQAKETLVAAAFGDEPSRTDPGVKVDLPTGWSPLHSIALILFGASAVDGHVADIEIAEILRRLIEYPSVDERRARDVLSTAYEYGKRHIGARGLSGLVEGLSIHGAILANGYPEETLRAILLDVEHVVGADGVLDPSEHEYLIALKHQFGLG